MEPGSTPAPERISFTAGLLKTEVLAGLTVALALIPEAVAFSFVAHVDVLVGLYAAFIVGLITAVLGGRPGMISGATGALAVVMVGLVVNHGVEYLFLTVVLMGLFQIAAGAMRWGKFIRMVPHPVMLGFVNGLAIVIFLAQLSQFKVTAPSGDEVWMSGNALLLTLGLVGLTMIIIYLMPRLTKTIPAPLVAILGVSSLVIGFDMNVPSVGDLASISGGLPQFHIPDVPFNFETLKIILPYSIILASIGLIESLLTLNLVAEMTETKGGASRECAAQGVANVVTGFFGGMGGCAMIGQSMINVESGARTRISAIAAASFLLIFILFGSSLIERIPLASLVGVMFMVVIGTFAWRSLRIMHRIPRQDALVMILVTAVTVYSDLAVAVVVGVIVSALGYAWSAAKHIHARVETDADGAKIYNIEGLLFFGSTTGFQDLFSPKDDPDEVVIDFRESRVMDYSGLQVIDALAVRYLAAGKNLHLRHLSPDCKKLLHRAGKLVEVSVLEDPVYEVAVDYDQEFDKDGNLVE
ncbi:MAG: SulP family sulfate permease [Planctomycetota bacterium]